MTAVDMAKLNRPGVMSSYSSSGRKNTVHGSKSTVVGSTFNQARMTAATKFLSPSKGGHVSARIMAENSAPRYLSGSETAIIANRGSGQVASLQSGTSIFGVGAGMMMPSMPMGGMSTGGVLGFLAGTAGAAILNKVLSPGAQAHVQATAPLTSGQALSNGLSSLTSTATTISTNTDIQGCVDAMANATNSADLRSAIATAESQYATLQTTTEGLQEESKSAQAQVGTLDKARGNAEAALKEAKGNVNQQKDVVSDFTTQRDGAKASLETAMKNKGITNEKYIQAHSNAVIAKQALADATTNLTSAETKLNSTPETITQADGSTIHNPEYDIAKAQFEKAKAAKEKAEKDNTTAENAENAAKNDLSDAEKSVVENETNFKTQEDALKTHQNNLDKATNQQSKLEATLEVKQSEFDKANDALKEVKDKIDEFHTKTAELNGLRTQIDNYKNKLSKMESQEQKEYNNLQTKIQKSEAENTNLMQGVDASDGISKKERKSLDKIEQNNTENSARRTRSGELRTPVMMTQLSKATPTIGNDNNAYRTTTFEGETYYSRNNELITKEEYEAGTKA